MEPKRIKWNRTMGKMPEGSVLVTRRSRYGNHPYPMPEGASRDEVQQVVDNYERDLLSGDLRTGKNGRYHITVAYVREHLKGFDLACGCDLNMPCHGDVLLRVANGKIEG